MELTYSITLSKNDNDLHLSFLDENGLRTSYSPVVFAIYKINNDAIFYTENKEGNLKHGYNLNTKSFIDIDVLKSPICEIIDLQRY